MKMRLKDYSITNKGKEDQITGYKKRLFIKSADKN